MIVKLSHPHPRTRRAAFTLLEVLVVVAILVILASVAGIAVFRYLDDAKANTARMSMQTIEDACRNYAVQNGGDMPTSLEQLVDPSNGKPMLDGGMQALYDPWKNQYSYEVIYLEDGSPEPLVSTINLSGGGKRIYSSKHKTQGYENNQ